MYREKDNHIEERIVNLGAASELINVLNQREVVFVKRIQVVHAKKFFYITSMSRKLMAAFICFQKNGWKNFSVFFGFYFGIPPSCGYDCLASPSRLRLRLVTQTLRQRWQKFTTD